MEGSLHQLLKEVAVGELEREGYDLFLEPLESPLERLVWRFYRPDILGLMCNETMSSLILVECETNPRMRRMIEKISKLRQSFAFQKRLNEEHLLRLLLVIPPGVLHRVARPKIRGFWEIWVVSRTGSIIHRIPRFQI